MQRSKGKEECTHSAHCEQLSSDLRVNATSDERVALRDAKEENERSTSDCTSAERTNEEMRE